jgi:cell wall-associated NlpC family hydrolase
MRRIVLILFAATLALIVLSPAAFSADNDNSSADDQYANEDTTAEQQTVEEGTAPPEGEESTAAETTAEESAPPVPAESLDVPLSEVSQGSFAVGPGLPEENFPAYSQVVDNSTKGSFKAPGWKTESSLDGHHGKNYAVAQPGKKTQQAQFKVEAPADDTYSIYAWWPENKENGSATRFGVATADGTKWTQVNQQRDGGFWGKIGEYKMQEGKSYAVKIAPGKEGQAVADAIAVVRGVQSAPPDDEAATSGGDTTFQAAGGRPTGRDVLRKARRYLGKDYKWGTCTRTQMSCTCLTKKSFAPFGHKLPMSEEKQWSYAKNRGRVISSKSDLKPGDLLFFKEGGSSRITHVGVAARDGWLVHSSSYWDEVVEKQSKYVDGFYRGVRLRLR